MEIKYVFTEKEKELIKELHKMKNSFNYSYLYDEFRNKYKEEIAAFIGNDLLYYSNPGVDGEYIRYSVHSKALIIFKEILD